jgi:hypothetical protein
MTTFGSYQPVTSQIDNRRGNRWWGCCGQDGFTYLIFIIVNWAKTRIGWQYSLSAKREALWYLLTNKWIPDIRPAIEGQTPG